MVEVLGVKFEILPQSCNVSAMEVVHDEENAGSALFLDYFFQDGHELIIVCFVQFGTGVDFDGTAFSEVSGCYGHGLCVEDFTDTYCVSLVSSWLRRQATMA